LSGLWVVAISVTSALYSGFAASEHAGDPAVVFGSGEYWLDHLFASPVLPIGIGVGGLDPVSVVTQAACFCRWL
jgi:hypothetical protein